MSSKKRFTHPTRGLPIVRGVALAVVATLVTTPVFAWPVFVVGVAPQVPLQIGQAVGAANATAITTPLIEDLNQVIGAAANGINSTLTSALQTIGQNITQQNQAIASARYAAHVQSAYTPPADACATYTQAAYAAPNAVGGSYNKSVARYSGAVRASAAAAPVDQKRMIQDTHFNRYCDPNTDPNKCSGAPPPATNGAGDTVVGADQRASTLFSGAGHAGHVENATFTPEQQGAAQDFISNAIDGASSPRRLSPTEYLTPQGQQYEGLRIAYESRMSIARDALEDSLALRTPIAGSSKAIQDIINSDPVSASYINQRLNDPVSGVLKYSPNGDVSPLEMLSIEVGMRADNPAWVRSINTASDTNAILRDIAQMIALQLKMQLATLRQGESMAAMAAVSSAENSKSNMLPQLQAAEMAVISGVSQK